MKVLVSLFFVSTMLFCAPIENPADLHYTGGLDYYRLGDTVKAKAEFQKTLELEKMHPGAVNMLLVLEREIFKEDINDPFNSVLKEYFERGLVVFRKGENEKALQEWEKGLAISPANSQLREFIELAKPKAKDGERAEINPVKKEKKSSEHASVKKTSKTDNKSTEAVKPEQKKKVDEKKVSDLYYEGLKAYKLGDLKKAISLWEQVLLLDPDSKKTKRNLENAKNQIVQGEKK